MFLKFRRIRGRGVFTALCLVAGMAALFYVAGCFLPAKGGVGARAGCSGLDWASLLTGGAGVLFLACPAMILFHRREEKLRSQLANRRRLIVSSRRRELEARRKIQEREDAARRVDSLGTLSAGIAHDVNNILTIILNAIAAKEAAGVGSDMEELFATIRAATSRGRALTKELMTYAGNAPYVFRVQDPNDPIRELEQLIDNTVAPNVSVDFRLGRDLPPVDIAPMQFWKVIINLLKNASEAMNGMNGRICISTYPHTLTADEPYFGPNPPMPGPGVVYEIQDTGPGIPQEVQKRMFEPFYSTKSMGRGLGLATVFGIVGAHEGGIELESTLGVGTTFRIWLPVSSQTPEAPAAGDGEPQPAKPEESRKRNVCALLVDDDPFILKTTAILLKSMSVEVITAGDPRTAWTAYQKNADRLSLVLLDARLGQLDTVELLSEFREIRKDIPVAIVSGQPEETVQQKFAESGYDRFLGKPYTREELAACVNALTTKG
ncbi:MAG: response regulator [Kiritimatiellae bacterium]|nr:response regulator [Kiritimatiellia bacterium]